MIPLSEYEKIQESANFINNKISKEESTKISQNLTAVVLGSGLGHFAQEIETLISIPYREIPHLFPTSVEGHSGCLSIGYHNKKPLLLFQGRYHRYEGHSYSEVIRLIRLAWMLSAKNLIVTNAAGGINSTFRPGDLAIITDHINLTGNNPLIGENDNRFGERFPDMSQAYSKKFVTLALGCAEKLKLKIHKGIYAGVLGPCYETPAEINMFRLLGADMVGMSTVSEVIAASHLKLNVLGLSCITNMASGMLNEELHHEDVKTVANQSATKFSALLKEIINTI
jgi:purine-nucleoside phosphorylase